MQPQESGFEWMNAISGAVGAIFGAGSTLLTWIIRAARMEPTIRAEIVASEQRIEKKVAEMMDEDRGHFRDTLSAMREKINAVEREAVSREEFKEYLRQHREDFQQARQETREDFADLKRNIAEMMGRKTH